MSINDLKRLLYLCETFNEEIMLFSEFFAPTSKDIPSDAKIASHQLMLRAGMISQAASGIYYWLPLATRVLEK